MARGRFRRGRRAEAAGRDLTPRPAGSWEPVTQGESGAVVLRRADGAAYAKCVPADQVAELRGERDRVAWLRGTGLPGAEVIDWTESGDGAYLMTTAVPGVAAGEIPPHQRPQAVRRLAEVFHALHALPVADCPFRRPLAEVVDQAADVVRRGAVDPSFLSDEARLHRPEDLLARVRAEQPYADRVAEPVVCHGDACLPNVLLDPDTLEPTGLIDLGRLGVADRYADLALTCAQLTDEWSLDPGGFLREYGLAAPDRRRLDFYLLLDPLTWG